MFTEEQKRFLIAPLSSCHVKARNQGGRSVSYIEGWHVIAEANRIFGFDAWTRETVEVRCVSEKERTIGSRGDSGWGVTYIARVRVTVRTSNPESITSIVIREGCGSGHGIDRDLGQAHESAIKEAETDAMKRALMTFGNPFGLALYDKQQTNVADDPPAASPSKPAPLLSEPQASEEQKKLIQDINGCIDAAELDKFIKSDNFKSRVAKLPEKHRGFVRAAYKARGEKFKQPEAA